MSDQLNQFAAHLATITDEDERKKLVRQALMLAVNEAPQEAFEAPIRTARDYLAATIEIPPVIIGTEEYPAVVRAGVNARIGRAGKGKTVGFLNQAIRWSIGLPWFDTWHSSLGEVYYAPQDGPVKTLIVENEGAGGLFHRQLGLMMYAEEYLSKEQREVALENLLIWGDGGYAGLKLDEDEKVKRLREGIEKWKPDIVFVEPLRSLWNGEENSSTEMSKVLDALQGIATDYQCGVVISHHESKAGTREDGEKMTAARGSSALEGFVTVMENWESAKGGDYRELSQSKNRHGNQPPPVRCEWDKDAWWYKHVPEGELDNQIFDALRNNSDEPMNVAELSEVTGEKAAKLRDSLKQLVKDGRLKSLSSVSTGSGSSGVRYRLPGDESGGLPV